jgi:hypothetical protein
MGVEFQLQPQPGFNHLQTPIKSHTCIPDYRCMDCNNPQLSLQREDMMIPSEIFSCTMLQVLKQNCAA